MQYYLHEFTTFNYDLSHMMSAAEGLTSYENASFENKSDGPPIQSVNTQYRSIRVLGEGTYGVVYEAVHIPTGLHVALKDIRPERRINLNSSLSISAIREIVLLRELQHPHIVRLLDVLHNNSHLVLVFELCETDLRHYVKNEMAALKHSNALEQLKTKCNLGAVIFLPAQPLLSFKRIRSIAQQLISALSYCHSRRIMHRDLKPQNILLDNEGTCVKMADLGLSRSFSNGTQQVTNEVVTLWYRPPEVLLGDQHYTCALDLWSMGCVLVEMCIGKPLFYGLCEIDMLRAIFEVLGTPREPPTSPQAQPLSPLPYAHTFWRGVSKLPYYNSQFPFWNRNPMVTLKKIIPYADETFLHFLTLLLHYDPKGRPSAHDLLQHPWLTNP